MNHHHLYVRLARSVESFGRLKAKIWLSWLTSQLLIVDAAVLVPIGEIFLSNW
jgi:hypothetical protein